MELFIARQPILDRHERVYGFEILLRPGGEVIWPAVSGDGSGEIASPVAPVAPGIEEITDGTRAFIKCAAQALTEGYAAGLPRDQVVLEVNARMDPNPAMVEACRKLKSAGFLIALEDFLGKEEEPLADLAHIIKLDVTASAERAQWLLIRKYRPKGTIFVADKVATRVQFQAAVQQGFSYFQGPFFLCPQPHSASEVAPTKSVYLLVLSAVARPEINVQELANTIKHDLALSYKLLRFLNSARFAFHSQIKSIPHALLLLGQNEIRKWIGLISVASLGEGAPPILVTLALIRAAFCESLAPLLKVKQRQSDYFFLGLLSCMDVLIGRPMRLVLAELPLAPDVSAALTGEQNSLRDALQITLSFEQGNWEEFSRLAEKLALDEQLLNELYLQALRWSRELIQARKNEPAEALSRG